MTEETAKAPALKKAEVTLGNFVTDDEGQKCEGETVHLPAATIAALKKLGVVK